MPCDIVLLDGTKIRVPDSATQVTEKIEPTSAWSYFNEGDGKPMRWFNHAAIAYVVDIEEQEPVYERAAW